jgi:hypothetical protein
MMTYPINMDKLQIIIFSHNHYRHTKTFLVVEDPKNVKILIIYFYMINII